MAGDLALTFSCGDYEIVRALKEGLVKPEGIDLDVVIMDSRERHWRMARGNEFDVCEFNAGAYVMARDRGAPYTAIPVFLHRRFRHGFVFVNAAAGIERPADLIGRRVGGTNYQPAGNIWIRGILEEEFDVPPDSITWVTERAEDIPFTPPDGLSIEMIPQTESLDDMLADGRLDAIISPNVVRPLLDGDPRVRRLFPDYKAREIEYYRRTGLFPIMHVTTVKQSILDDHPWVAQSLVEAFEAAKRVAYARLENPRIVPLAWHQTAWEEQREILGPDPWEYGLGEINRRNLETLARYVHRQGLAGREPAVDELFAKEA
jgi:4,5-dihydroxyphthalate decarboxylase